MWTIEFYHKRSNHCPAEEFISGLQANHRVLMINDLQNLAKLGHNARMPLAKPLGNGLYELRTRIEKNQYRLLYFFFEKDRIIITNGLKKKRGEVLQSEIDKANEYRTDYLNQKSEKGQKWNSKA